MERVRDTTPLSADEEALVRALGRGIKQLARLFDADLLAEQGMSQAEYNVLMFLSEAPQRTLRLTDLAHQVQQSLSAISRTVGRLEQAGLVHREQSCHDARSYNAVLTDAGLERLRDAWPTHVASVRRHLLDHLGGVDLRELAAALERVGDPGSGGCATGDTLECE